MDGKGAGLFSGGWVSHPFAFVYRVPGYMPGALEQNQEQSDTGF